MERKYLLAHEHGSNAQMLDTLNEVKVARNLAASYLIGKSFNARTVLAG